MKLSDIKPRISGTESLNILKKDISPSKRVSSVSAAFKSEVPLIDINQLKAYSHQARLSFSEDEISKLGQSIQNHGLRQPLTVIPSHDDFYEIVSGERRFRAAQKIGLEKVPCIILEEKNLSDEVAIVENTHRENLHPLELAKAFKSLLERGKFKSQSEICSRLGFTKSYVSELVSFLDIPKEEREFLISNNIRSRSALRSARSGKKKKNIDKEGPTIKFFYKKGKISVTEKNLSELKREEIDEITETLESICEKLRQC